MKKLTKIIFIFLIIINTITVSAETKNKNESISEQITNHKKIENLNLEKIFVYFSKFFEENTPESYKYIALNFSWIEKWGNLEKALKILVYNNKIPNLSYSFKWIENKEINSKIFYKLSAKILWTYDNSEKETIDKKVDYNDLEIVEQSYLILKNSKFYETNNDIKYWTTIFDDVYETIINEHFDKQKIDKQKIIYSAIEWLTKWVWDKHTVFFPPTESKDFLSSLSWDFEWIGTYVEMPEPWVFMISSPIPWWPADKLWIKWWDIIIEVDWKEITKENSQNEIISWIKWPAWTEVKLKIKRWNEIFELKVTREKVHIKSIDTKASWNSFIIKIIWFNEWINQEFVNAIEELKSKVWIRKIVFDLRNNWWWYLDEVVEILSTVISKWENVAFVKYLENEWNYVSRWLDLLNLDDYEVVFLQNEATASASEIMIWTIKDYYPKVKIVWEKSYWKWSVQTIKELSDGSSLKYTTAKWFTWKTKTWIDWIWIKPDVEIKFDENRFKRSWIDNQMEKALSI